MFVKIKNKIERELSGHLLQLINTYSLNKISPLLSKSIKEFVLGDGKRIRPVLFIIGYSGYSKKTPKGLYKSAISLELLHDCALIHDDIIDKAITRRGNPTMHEILNKSLFCGKNIKVKGQDLAVIAGDMLYAAAIDAFLSIKVSAKLKEGALKKLLQTVIHTGSGEFSELIYSTKDIRTVTKNNVYKIYDLKTANYTFACPLSLGAMLAGANKNQIERLFRCGLYLGRAFQIKDDMVELFCGCNLSDLQESKKTILMWHAFNNAKKSERLVIENILSKKRINNKDLLMIRKIMAGTKTLCYAKKEIFGLIKQAEAIHNSTSMRPGYKKLLGETINRYFPEYTGK